MPNVATNAQRGGLVETPLVATEFDRDEPRALKRRASK